MSRRTTHTLFLHDAKAAAAAGPRTRTRVNAAGQLPRTRVNAAGQLPRTRVNAAGQLPHRSQRWTYGKSGHRAKTKHEPSAALKPFDAEASGMEES